MKTKRRTPGIGIASIGLVLISLAGALGSHRWYATAMIGGYCMLLANLAVLIDIDQHLTGTKPTTQVTIETEPAEEAEADPWPNT